MNSFHFLRPEALWLGIPFGLLIIAFMYFGPSKTTWHKICSKELIPYIISDGAGHSYLFSFLGLGLILLIIGLAGPSITEKPVPLVKPATGLAIVLDLSPAMDATDLKPTRLKRALYKISDLLKARKGGQTALIVFAEDPYVVTPLTEDSATIEALLPALETNIMPTAGHGVKKALAKASDLLRQGGINQGRILLITGELSAAEAQDAAALARQENVSVSILGIGSDQNTPILKPDGSFLADKKGALIITRLDKESMQKLASDTKGTYATIQHDDSDIHALKQSLLPAGDMHKSENIQFVRQDEGYWLILLALPLIALSFRRGVVIAMALLFSPSLQAYDFSHLWSTMDQQGEAHFHNEQYTEAKEKFTRADWLGATNYKLGDYAAAADLFQQDTSLDGLYNYATAKAKSGDLQEALSAYKKVLDTDPAHEDALYNKQVIEEFLKQQQPPQDSKEQKTEDKSSENKEQQPPENKSDSAKEGDKSQGESKNGEDGAEKSAKEEGTQGQADKDGDDKVPEKSTGSEQDPKNNGADGESDPTKMQADFGKEIDDKLQDPPPPGAVVKATEDDSASDNQKRMDERVLKRIEDNPGELLRRKFMYQYKQQRQGF